MPRSVEEQQHEDFDCPRLGDSAPVTLTFKRIPLNPGPDKRVLVNMACDCKDRCGIGVVSENGRATTYDFPGKCDHPVYAAKRQKPVA